MNVKLQVVTPKAEENIVHIARASSSRVDKKEDQPKLINYLINNKHWSPFEHASMTIEIITTKAIAIQLLRHRSFTFQEFSQRYAKVTDIEPVEFRLQAEKNRQSSTDFLFDIKQEEGVMQLDNCLDESAGVLGEKTIEVLNASMDVYKELLDAGVAKECARMLLPMCTQTKMYMTGSLRSWIHMLDIRDDSHAQLEAQLIAKQIKNIFIDEFPIISEARNYVRQ